MRIDNAHRNWFPYGVRLFPSTQYRSSGTKARVCVCVCLLYHTVKYRSVAFVVNGKTNEHCTRRCTASKRDGKYTKANARFDKRRAAAATKKLPFLDLWSTLLWMVLNRIEYIDWSAHAQDEASVKDTPFTFDLGGSMCAPRPTLPRENTFPTHRHGESWWNAAYLVSIV